MSDNYLKLLFQFWFCIEDKTVFIMLHKFTQTTEQNASIVDQ